MGMERREKEKVEIIRRVIKERNASLQDSGNRDRLASLARNERCSALSPNTFNFTKR
jgi:hypothetical protein